MASNDDPQRSETPAAEPENRSDEFMAAADDMSRVIMLLKGVMDHGGPFWCYVALKPSRYAAFKAAEAASEINLYDFDEYGEVIVSGEGDNPPYPVTEEVARRYSTDPRSFFRDIDPIAEIEMKMRKLGQDKTQDSIQSKPNGSTRWADKFRN